MEQCASTCGTQDCPGHMKAAADRLEQNDARASSVLHIPVPPHFLSLCSESLDEGKCGYQELPSGQYRFSTPQ